MSSIEISQSLRPLKLAYVIKPGDFSSLERVIKINSFLWGAEFNPILPFYRKVPKQLRQEVEVGNTRSLFHGSLDFFQPDFVVRCDGIEAIDIEYASSDILQLDEISTNIKTESRPGFGVGMPELLRSHYDEHERFVRKNPVKNFLPTYGRNHRCFLKSVFGDFPDELNPTVRKHIIEDFDAQEPSISLSNYLKFLQGHSQNLHDLSSLNIDFDYAGDVPRERYVIYYLDPTSFIDIVSYRNLIAAGYSVLPIARQLSKSEEAKSLCLDFIQQGSWVHPDNPHAKTHVTLQKSPSVEQSAVDEFYKFLSPPNFEPLAEFPDTNWPRCTLRHWLPPFWSQFHWEKGDVNCATLTAARTEDDVPIRDDRSVKVRALAPEFISDRSLKTFNPRYAIDVHINSYGLTDFETGIIPSGSEEVARSFGLFGKHEWLIKRTGITSFPKFKSSIYFEIPRSHDVFISWLKSQGWDAEISSAGKVAYQMLRHLNGPWHIIMMQSRKFVEHLSGHLFANGKSVKAGEFKHRILKEIYDDLDIFWGEDKFFKALLDSKIIELGAQLQCDVCSRRSWHSVLELDRSMRCPRCLSDFEIPAHNPRKIEWAYKTIGPFSAHGRAGGAYSVLLTAYFFNDRMNRNSTTTVLSFVAQKGNRKIEADLGIFYRESAFFDRTQETIFCECKTFNRFNEVDVERMKNIAIEFPGAMLVFATLNYDLDDNEKSLLAPLARQCNKYHERDRPLNPVMILTGTELFSGVRPPYVWEKMDGKYEAFGKSNHIRSLLEICRATQQLYLDLPPWQDEWYKAWEQHSAKQRKKL